MIWLGPLQGLLYEHQSSSEFFLEHFAEFRCVIWDRLDHCAVVWTTIIAITQHWVWSYYILRRPNLRFHLDFILILGHMLLFFKVVILLPAYVLSRIVIIVISIPEILVLMLLMILILFSWFIETVMVILFMIFITIITTLVLGSLLVVIWFYIVFFGTVTASYRRGLRLLVFLTFTLFHLFLIKSCYF